MAKRGPKNQRAGQRPARAVNAVPLVNPNRSEWTLDTLRDLQQEIDRLELVRTDVVKLLRKRGLRWMDIAVATGMSVEGARLKYRDAP